MLSKDTLQFLDDLKANNNRDWFLENKKRYEVFKNDYLQTASDLLDVLKPLDASLEMLEAKKCTFRINRDIRFSKDKTPYKTHLSFWFSSGAKGQNRSGYYIHLEKGASFIAGGLYCPEADDLKKIRKEIAFFYDDLQEILDEKNFKREFGNFAREEKNTLKNPPRGYEKEHPAIDFLKLKSFESAQKIDISAATKKDFVTIMGQKLIVLKPLNDFINRALTSE
ncbi:TIGR02453 family protein [Flavobacterium segetis]|uniref:TIGR02453 family protein n=1 Tax=Flavobacterium segetis TaxID=271157 RepID=A0A1M5EKT8_9FLAO|nr:DUF2461 domain-containing protein [Flavobacterium segetis]SHF79754.1 TIGR02453 family protein [Flavobacterium segetis]